MSKLSTDPAVLNAPPTSERLTPYDQDHAALYLRLLDAEREAVDWREAARLLLHIDPDAEPARAEVAWRTHLERAHWMTRSGYAHLLAGGSPPH